VAAVRRVAARARFGWAADRIPAVSRNGDRTPRLLPGVPRLGLWCLRLGAILAATGGVVLRSAPARAAVPTEPAPSAAILITFDPASAEQGPVVAAVRAHLRGVPVRVLAEPIAKARSVGQKVATSGELATASGAIGTLSVELAEDGAVLIFFTEPDGSATLIRRLPPNEQGVRTTVEQVAIVVRSLVEALLDGARVGLTPGQPAAAVSKDAAGAPAPSEKRRPRAAPRAVERPAPPRATAVAQDEAAGDDAALTKEGEPPVSSAAASSSVALTAAYAGTQFAANTGWQSGFALGITWRALPPLHAGARYTFTPELEGGTETTRVSVARQPAEVTVGYMGATTVAPSAELGLVADHTRRRTRSNAPGYTPTPATRRWMVALGARAGVTWTATEALALTLRGGADFLLTRYSYVVSSGQPVASPRPIRPRLELEVAVSLW
jgi:hypothetical protein